MDRRTRNMIIAFVVGFLVAGITGITIMSLNYADGIAKITYGGLGGVTSSDYNDPIVIDSFANTNTIGIYLKGDLVRFGEFISLTVTIRSTEPVQYWKYLDWVYNSEFVHEFTISEAKDYDMEKYITRGVMETSDTFEGTFRVSSLGLREVCLGIAISYTDMAGNVIGAADEDYINNQGCFFFSTLDEKLTRTDNPYEVDEVPDNDVNNFIKNYPTLFTMILIATICLIGIVFVLVRKFVFKAKPIKVRNIFNR